MLARTHAATARRGERRLASASGWRRRRSSSARVLDAAVSEHRLEQNLARRARYERDDRQGQSRNGLCVTHRRLSSSIAAGDTPAAYWAAITAPMLVPPIWSIGMPASSSARSTPMWANPLAAPPPKHDADRVPVRQRASRSTCAASSEAHCDGRRTAQGQPCRGTVGCAARRMQEHELLAGAGCSRHRAADG